MTIQEIESIVFYSEQNQVWRNSKGQRHRAGGPAILYSNGTYS